MRSRSVTCNLKQVNAPRLTPARNAAKTLHPPSPFRERSITQPESWHLFYYRMEAEGWVDLGGWSYTLVVYLSVNSHPSKYWPGPVSINLVEQSQCAHHYTMLPHSSYIINWRTANLQVFGWQHWQDYSSRCYQKTRLEGRSAASWTWWEFDRRLTDRHAAGTWSPVYQSWSAAMICQSNMNNKKAFIQAGRRLDLRA